MKSIFPTAGIFRNRWNFSVRAPLYLLVAGVFVFLSFSIFPAEAAQNLCTTNEVVVFSCLTKRRKPKLASLCANKEWSAERGYLVYRYGRKRKIELEYPKDRAIPKTSFQVLKNESLKMKIGQEWTPGTNRVLSVSRGFAFTPSNVTYQIVKKEQTSTPIDAWNRPLEEGKILKKTTHAIKVILPKRTITIPCKRQSKNSITSAVSHFIKTLLPTQKMTACRKGETKIFNCKYKGHRSSICQDTVQRKFARVLLKGGERYSFLIDPTQQNPLKIWRESYVRHQTNFIGYDGSQGSISSTGGFYEDQEGEPGTTFNFKQPKVNIYCSREIDLRNMFPGAPLIEKQ